jgi:hypothetical protein
VSGDVATELHSALTHAATELTDVELVTTPGATEFRTAGRPFASLHGAVVEFDLDDVVARAARATPGATSSQRGSHWVAFSPAEFDRFARDRAIAWLGSAHRRARAAARGRN